MPSASPGSVLVLRLARISTLVLGSLIFLHSCEVRAGLMAGSSRIELIVAAVLAVIGISITWFELNQAKKQGHQGFLVESEDCVVRAKIVHTGELVFRGHDLHGAPSDNEWAWTFAPATFPAIRDALGGGRGELLDLLERTVPHLDPDGRRDPGAWLREHGIPAIYRERGVSATRKTRELPIIDITLADDPPTKSRRTHKAAPDSDLLSPTRIGRDLSAVLARMRAAVPQSEPEPELDDENQGPLANSRPRRSRAALDHEPEPLADPRARPSRSALEHDPEPDEDDWEQPSARRRPLRAKRSRPVRELDPEYITADPEVSRGGELWPRAHPDDRAIADDPGPAARRPSRIGRRTRPAPTEFEQFEHDPEPAAEDWEPPARQRPLRARRSSPIPEDPAADDWEQPSVRQRPLRAKRSHAISEDPAPVADDSPMSRRAAARRRASHVPEDWPEYDTAAPELEDDPFELPYSGRRSPTGLGGGRRPPVQGAADYLPGPHSNSQSPWPSTDPARNRRYRPEPEYDSGTADYEYDAYESSRISRRPPARRRARPTPAEHSSAPAEPAEPWPRPDRDREPLRSPEPTRRPPRYGGDRSAALRSESARRPFPDESYPPPSQHGPRLPYPPYAEPAPRPNPRLPPPPDLAPPGRHRAAFDPTYSDSGGAQPSNRSGSDRYWDD